MKIRVFSYALIVKIVYIILFICMWKMCTFEQIKIELLKKKKGEP